MKLSAITNEVNIVIRSDKGYVLHWSGGCERLYGWSESAVRGLDIHSLLQTAFPIPRTILQDFCISNGKWEGTLKQRTREGRALIVRTHWTVKEEKNRRIWIETITDVTELVDIDKELASRESELATVLEAIPDAIVTTDSSLRIRSFSRVAKHMFGIGCGEVAARCLSSLIHIEACHLELLLQGRFPDDGRTLELYGTARRADGSSFDVQLKTSHLRGGNTEILVWLIRDVPRCEEVESRKRQCQKLKILGRLTSGVAHDFSNLLTVIGGNVEMLEARCLEADLLGYITEIREAVAIGSGFTNQLLAFARQQPLTPEIFEIGSFLNRLANLIQRAQGAQIEVVLEIQTDKLHVRADPAQLASVILNLALNARDAMPDGGTFTIQADRAALASDPLTSFVRIALSDTGVGMSAEVRARAYDPFFTTKAIGQGTGLGLSNVVEFIEQSGGRMSLDSTEGLGTKIELYFPSVETER
ncbi:ATP-binding protein [Methylobacterium sp. P31]